MTWGANFHGQKNNLLPVGQIIGKKVSVNTPVKHMELGQDMFDKLETG